MELIEGFAAAGLPQAYGRSPATAMPTDSTSYSPTEAHPVNFPPVPSHRPRDLSLNRGRALSVTSPRNATQRPITPAVQARAKQSLEVERNTSQYEHHRKTSIVNGVQHSRNPSLLSSTSTSPLSPHRILTSGAAVDVAHPDSAGGLRESPSMSTIPAGSVSGVSHQPTSRALDGRKPDGMHSGRKRRTRDKQRAQSRSQAPPELKTVGEYALHHLFTSFIAEADDRIERCMPTADDSDPQVESVCGPGTDAGFDQLIASLGRINRHKPKSLIDAVIHWRKKKADLANAKMNELHATRDSYSLTHSTPIGLTSAPGSPHPLMHNIIWLEREVAIAERRSRVSIYILCRVLIEIIGQTTAKALEGPENTAARLEEVIYGQLQSVDPESIATASLNRACWSIRGQLLGVMSAPRLEQVSDRFRKDLELAHRRLSVKGLAEPRLAEKTALLVQSMRWLKVRSQPEEAWNRSVELLRLLARFFAEVHGRVMKYAYAQLFEHLLLPIAATATTTELNLPRWRDVVADVQPKLTQMLPKADHWPHVFPLQAILLCVSPSEQFSRDWLPFIMSFQPKARDRASRSHALKALCRLVWRFLYHEPQSPNVVARKLDDVIRLVLPGSKRFLISTDPAIADPLIQLIRIIGYKHQDLCFRAIIFPLMNSDLFSGPEQSLKIESLDPEKTVIGIRAFLAVMADLEKGEQPPFPASFECDALVDPSSHAPVTHRRTRSQGFAESVRRTERLSHPVPVHILNEVSKEYYVKFCKILGQLTIICDNTFGGQAVLEEKLATLPPPRTPMADAFTFTKKDDPANSTDLRQHYYDLLHVAVEALPRSLSPHLPINPLVNLLCTGTAHIEPHIASSSAQSLKSIARQSNAQVVTIGFARFIFAFDGRYATVSDGSLLGPGHIESTLGLYVELLQIWIDDIQRRTRRATSDPVTDEERATKPLPLDLSGILAHVDEVESHGLFFLCSPSRAVRAIAVTVLHLVTKFDKALGKPSVRIISMLQGSSNEVIDLNDDHLTLAERSRLQKGLRKGSQRSTLVELCSSEAAHDATLWFKIFPNLIRLSSQTCLHAVALTRELVCQRLSHSSKTIGAVVEGNKQANPPSSESASRPSVRLNSFSPDIIVEQWKIHVIFACTTLTNIGGTPSQCKPSASLHHPRRTASQDKIASAFELFSKVVPFVSVPNAAVRNAAVVGLGATNAALYHSLLESLHPLVSSCSNDAKDHINSHQRTVSSPRRGYRTDYLRTEITHLLSLTSPLLKHDSAIADDYALEYLVDYTRSLRHFLSDAETQTDLSLHKLRTYFCTLLEGLYECTRRRKDSSRWMSFQSRQASFSLMEDWCGFSPNESQLQRQEDYTRRAMLEREVVTSAFQKEKLELQSAALSAMASLCAGPLTLVAKGSQLMHFDVRRLLTWIHAIFETLSDRVHATGRKALQNLIVHNLDQPYLMGQAMRMCYIAKSPKALASYFEVVTRVLTENTTISIPFWKTICVSLFTLGNDDSAIRTKSARLLRTLEEQLEKTSKLQDLEISVSDKTTAVYKLAQFEISRRLATQHSELAFFVFSEFSAYFNELEPDHQRNMVSGMLPWIQTIELHIDANGAPIATSYMLLVNMFEITVKSSITLHNEIQALWQALATGPYGGNVQLILDFIIGVCLDHKEQNFVAFAKQIVVFLSKTPAGLSVVGHLLQRITPRTMIASLQDMIATPADTAALPYIADLSSALPSGDRSKRMALGHLCMILMVDLVVSPFSLAADKVPVLLHVVLILWDYDIVVVQEQAREMLVHLIHELVISKIDAGSTEPAKQSIEEFIDSVRRQDAKISWMHTDFETSTGEPRSAAVPDSMIHVIENLISIFSLTYPGIREDWGKVAIQWATSCPVRHIACKCFQVFRCISVTLDTQTLQEILIRLSNTIASVDINEHLLFSLEVLTTLRALIDRIRPMDVITYPQLFWTAYACLGTIHEREFREGLGIFDALLAKLDLDDPGVVNLMKESRPLHWEGGLQGLHILVSRGMRSEQSMGHCLSLMERLIRAPSNELVGGEERVVFTFLANLPRYLHFLDEPTDPSCLDSAATLAVAAESHSPLLARALHAFARERYRSQDEFLSQSATALRTAFFPDYEFQSLVFLLGLVNNQCAWFKMKTMQVLCTMIPEIDMRKPEIACHGPDLISPLLRLLQTEHCQQALDVLDNVIDMTGTPLDHKHLRMSMAGSHSSRAARKEYDSTKSLYGIPEESGWSVPMPAVSSKQTQHNVFAISQTLVFPEVNGASSTSATPEIEFHREDNESYFTERTLNASADDGLVDGGMTELAMKLDSLDDFFDDPTDLASTRDSAGQPRCASGLIEELYNEQALPILYRSLHRNASVTSFHKGFAETRYPSREPAVMNPGAFAQDIPAPLRPELPGRSITSPPMASQRGLPYLSNDLTSGDETGDEPEAFSDDDATTRRPSTADEREEPQTMVKPAGFRTGFRHGLRRLTTSGAREASRASSARSPRVPRVPITFLRDPVTGDP